MLPLATGVSPFTIVAPFTVKMAANVKVLLLGQIYCYYQEVKYGSFVMLS